MSTGLCPDCGHPWDEHEPDYRRVPAAPSPNSVILTEGFDSYVSTGSGTKCGVCGCATPRPSHIWDTGPIPPRVCGDCGREESAGEEGWTTRSEKIIGPIVNEVRFVAVCPTCGEGTEP